MFICQGNTVYQVHMCMASEIVLSSIDMMASVSTTSVISALNFKIWDSIIIKIDVEILGKHQTLYICFGNLVSCLV